MHKPITLTDYDFPDTAYRPCGYNVESYATATDKNFEVLLDHYNNLVEVVNLLCEGHNIELPEEE